MLFDLRGAGRRNTVKAVYLLLALLMGVGLIGFGIGGAGLGGGLVDAITGSSGSSGTGADTFLKRAQAAQARAVAAPKNATLWADAARARYQAAVGENFFDQNTQQFNDAGKAQLRIADEDWQKHLALNPNPPDDGAAGVMIKVYSPGALNEPDKAVAAQEIITENRPKARTFATLAVLAYDAGQTRKGDLARDKALKLTEPDMRQNIKGQLDAARSQALLQSGQSATPTPSPAAG